MKLPNAHLAIVEQEKITEYRLNPAHRYGASKARFFTDFGFPLDDWSALARALQRHGQQYEVSTPHTLWEWHDDQRARLRRSD